MVARALRAINAAIGRRALFWAVVLAATAAYLCTVPLFNLLGYDYSFVVGLVAALASVDIGHGAAAAARRRTPAPPLAHVVVVAVAGALGVLVLPLLLGIANAARVQNCNIAAGLAFYALLPVGTALYAAPAGAIAGTLGPRRGRVVAFALPALSVGWALSRLYSDPAIFALDPFGGYFPGPIYDEALRPPPRLLTFRLVNLLWVGGAVAASALLWRPLSSPDRALPVSRRIRQRPWLALVAATLVGAGALAFALRGPLGFHVKKDDVLRTLSRETRSPHFILHTDPGPSEEERALVMRDLEFRYTQLARILGASPSGPITVYRFPSAEVKKEVVGAGHTLFAKPWKREIFVQADRFPAGRLRHELAHVFAGAFGDPVFGVSLALGWWGPIPVPRLASGLIEGIAEAADFGDPDGRSTLHQESRAMVADGRAPPLAKVVGAGFTTVAGARAYTLAGSFCRFLLDRHGPERLRALYRSAGDFVGVYGQPLDVLERQWRAFLETQPLDKAERARARERFRRPAIFQKVCARELAARVAEARSDMGSDPARAVTLLESVCRDDPNEPSFRLDLADAFTYARRFDRALALSGAASGDETLTLPMRARAANLAAAIHFHAGRWKEAEEQTTRALSIATDDGEERTALAKLRALSDEEARKTLGRVLFGDGPHRAVDAALAVYLLGAFAERHPDEALGGYLLGRQLAFRDPALGVRVLGDVCGEGAAFTQPLAPVFQRECRRLLGETAFLAGDLHRSATMYRFMRDAARNEAERLRALDFLERIAWEEARLGKR